MSDERTGRGLEVGSQQAAPILREEGVVTDTEVVLARLRQGPASTNDLLAAGYAANGVGLVVNSRISDARRLLAATRETITCHRDGTTTAGRPQYVYEIVSLVPSEQLCLSV